MAKRRTIIDRLPLAPVFALMFGTAVAVVIAATPQWMFEGGVASTGLGNQPSGAELWAQPAQATAMPRLSRRAMLAENIPAVPEEPFQLRLLSLERRSQPPLGKAICLHLRASAF